MLVRWPTEAEQRSRLAERHIPRLLLVDDGIPPPDSLDCLEDWIRLPAPESDVRARIDALLTRSRAHLRTVPEIDAHGVLRFGSSWVSLPPVEARLADALVIRFGAVVGRDTLRRSVWPGTAPVATSSTSTCFDSAAACRRSAWPSAPSAPGATCSSGPSRRTGRCRC